MTITIKVNGTSNTLVHKGSNGISTATVPDVCKTPSPGGPVPIPYPNISMSSDLDKGTKTVKADGGNMIANKGSEFSRSTGDEPGTAGGVKSSVNMKESTWILYSFDVKMEGKNACRLTDKKFQNKENTVDLGGTIQEALNVEKPEFCEMCKNCAGKHSEDKIAESKMMQGEYFLAGQNPANQNNKDIDAAVMGSLKSWGIEMRVVATYNVQTQDIRVVPQEGPCAKLDEHAGRVHEESHKRYHNNLKRMYGPEKADKMVLMAENHVEDEMRAYGAQQREYEEFQTECRDNCP